MGSRSFGREDADRFGGKSASLGELLHAGIPVPPGFAISTEAGEELTDILRRDIAARYGELGGDVPVAVRSSALGEDSAEATFAGQQDTYLWVRGVDAVCDAVTKCWASLYNPEAVAYRERFGVENPGDGGHHPAHGRRCRLGRDVHLQPGQRRPQHGRDQRQLGPRAGRRRRRGHARRLPRLQGHRRGGQADDQRQGRSSTFPATTGRSASTSTKPAATSHASTTTQLADPRRPSAKRVEKHFGAPQDIEWAFDRPGELFVLQSRPVTGLAQKEATPAPTSAMSMIFNKFGAAG